MLAKKVGGSFFVRRSEKTDEYVITAKATREQINNNNGKYSHYKVMEEMYRNQKHFYIRKGEAFQSLLELIMHHKHDFGFNYPFKHNGRFKY